MSCIDIVNLFMNLIKSVKFLLPLYIISKTIKYKSWLILVLQIAFGYTLTIYINYTVWDDQLVN